MNIHIFSSSFLSFYVQRERERESDREWESVILSAADDQQLLEMTLQYGIILVYLLESVLMQKKTFWACSNIHSFLMCERLHQAL